ncbi:hypothetical protein FU139_31545, partial [Burkholderia territorii]
MHRRRTTGWHAIVLLLAALVLSCATHRAHATENPAQLDSVSLLEDPGTRMSVDQAAARLADSQRRAAAAAR